MDEAKQNEAASDPPWQAYGPAKEKWKAEGNYYTAEELAKMQKDFLEAGLVIKPRRRKIYDAN
jgi:hypothetical protein